MNYISCENKCVEEFSSEEKTLFTFTDSSGEKSTLTLDKWIADALVRLIDGGDVHAWIQAQYDRIVAQEKCLARYIKTYKTPGKELSRRSVGDIIRALAINLVASNIDDSDW